MKKASLLAIAALAALSAQAQTTEKSIGSDVRLLSKDIVLSDVSSSSASVKLKQKAEGKQLNVIVDEAFLSSEWSPYSFTFTPSASGTINIEFRGTKEAPANQYVAYDTITAEGAELRNGGFEEFAEGKPNPKFWWGDFKPEQVLKDSEQAQYGITFAASRDDKPFRTNFKVTANQPVTITYFIKRVMLESAE